ncbi:DUF695 domain-containing protein [Paenisporosarcina sp. TG20]|uniref:DUF695 domain-containing protein n=1 Tax=Paenisporosarcina sp. TG20 TaxID=1211706 RepID=UPI0003108C50|nr:DUF695 domain-containing protein [Paenisporosarcina sp. TG20]
MSEFWDTYFDLIDEKPAAVVLDMEVSQEIDTEQYKNAFVVRFRLKSPNEEGLHVGAEADQLNEIEETLMETAELINYINVGRITTNGIRDIIFYSTQEEETALASEANGYYHSLGYEMEVFKIEEDTNWEFYFEFLYPDSYQIQHIGNHSVLEALEESGDKLETPRKLEHTVLFQNEMMKKRFIKTVKKVGFTIEEETLKKDEEGDYVICISRVDSVDYNSIDELTDLLLEIAEKFEGEYDGWETIVIEA